MSKQMKHVFVSLVLGLTLIGCAGSKVSQIPFRAYTGAPIETIALSPGGGVLGEAVSVELFNLGYMIVDPDETVRLIGRSDLSEFEVAKAASLVALSQKGIDAILVVKAAAGVDGRPQSATARITNTRTTKIIAAVSWQNGWGGMSGSPADRIMRKDVAAAAREIAFALRQNLR